MECSKEMVELSGLVELAVAELSGVDCNGSSLIKNQSSAILVDLHYAEHDLFMCVIKWSMAKGLLMFYVHMNMMLKYTIIR